MKDSDVSFRLDQKTGNNNFKAFFKSRAAAQPLSLSRMLHTCLGGGGGAGKARRLHARRSKMTPLGLA